MSERAKAKKKKSPPRTSSNSPARAIGKKKKKKTKPKRPSREFKDIEIIEALLKCDGLVMFTAKKLRCDRSTVYARIKKVPAVAAACEEARNCMLDEAESHLHKLLKQGDFEALTYYLDRIGRQRGYGKSQEISGPGGAPVKFTLALGGAPKSV